VAVIGGSPFATGVPKFFLMQAFGIVIESIVLNFWAGIKETSVDDAAPAGRATKVLGYGWVLGWITWTGPSFTWLVARLLVQGRDDVVPWSLVKSLGYRKQ
jgi:hypothetical protein